MSRIDLSDIYCLTSKGNIYELTPVFLECVHKIGPNYYIKQKVEPEEVGSVEYIEEKIVLTGMNMFNLSDTAKYKTIPINVLSSLIKTGVTIVNKKARERINFKALEEFNYTVFMESDSDNCYRIYAKKIVLEKGSIFDHVNARY